MIRIHSEGFYLTTGPVTLTVICRARVTNLRLSPGLGSEMRRPAAIFTLRTPANWQLFSKLGGARAP